MPVEEQVVVLWAATNGPLDSVPVEEVQEWEAGLLDYMRTGYGDLLNTIKTEKQLSDETIAALSKAVDTFKGGSKWAAGAKTAAVAA
jgi:F-type H+-transporting ATPase subunit alpha